VGNRSVEGVGNAVTRTLEDTLVAAIQRAPCQPLAKLALADLLEERGSSLEANALRWCAGNRKWPQRRGYIGDYRTLPNRGEQPTGYLWQWWHPSVETSRRWSRVFRAALWAIVTDEISRCWSDGTIWAQSTWFASLTVLGLALKQLEESNANGKDEDGTFSAVGWSL
jgi:hypothetical protein